MSSARAQLDFRWSEGWDDAGAMTLSFLYLAFVRIVQVLRLSPLVSPATFNDDEGDALREHEFVNVLTPWWSFSMA